MPGLCNDNWYQMVLFPNQTYASSVPLKYITECVEGTPSPTSNTPSPTYKGDIESLGSFGNLATEAKHMVPVTMILGLLFLMIVLCRSQSRVKLDWYRLIGIYIFVTIAVPVSIAVGPSGGGFNRVIGFGILIHNLGETFILNHIWFGDVGHKGRNKFSALFAILYVWVIMALISFLDPLWLLFLILMLQGMIFFLIHKNRDSFA